MPRGDGTGPMGMGSMTGRRGGYCAGYDMPGYANPAFGRGYFGPGMGRGSGRGLRFRHWFYATGLPFCAPMNPFFQWPQAGAPPYGSPPMDKETEIDMLKAEAADMEDALKQIQDRLTKLQDEK
ncbi:MAG: hypothetical protein A2Y65_01655 [Deltaproteobacteria bacterium RBG_13_52_11]|nr:MAG: hypothetical protein A2Y65_01655 [Deltaproteobacteria bacterium RBG_13_52_11]